LFQPTIGSGLRGLLFEPIDSLVAASIEREIVEAINNFEPRARVSSVAAVPSPDENRYNIRLEFFIINDPNPITLNFF
jgi:phage baseplate assembly protein W